MSRPQVIVLVVGVMQVASSVLGFPDLGEPHRVLMMCTGLLGIVSARRLHHARIYGATLAIGHGAVAYAGVAEEFLVLHLRAVFVGLVIVFVPAGRNRARVTNSLKRETS